MSFEDTKMYSKGQIGEHILDEVLRKKGDWIPYEPVYDGAHPFDRIIATPDKLKLCILEVKTITARNSKPNYRLTGYPDTGISIAHYNEYLHIKDKYNMPVFIAFVDGMIKEIYGNYLEELHKPTVVIHRNRTLSYPKIEKNFSAVGKKIIYFPLVNMRRNISKLTDEQAKEVEKYSNYGYENDVSHKSGYQEWQDKKSA